MSTNAPKPASPPTAQPTRSDIQKPASSTSGRSTLNDLAPAFDASALGFAVTEEPDPDAGFDDEVHDKFDEASGDWVDPPPIDQPERLVLIGRFSRNWKEEDELDAISDQWELTAISDRQALAKATALAHRYPRCLEIRQFIACRLWDLDRKAQASRVWEDAYLACLRLIPKSFLSGKGRIPWVEIDNRSFLRVAHGYLLSLIERRDGKAADKLAKYMLIWNPHDLSVLVMLGDIALLNHQPKKAIALYLRVARSDPSAWYQAGKIAFGLKHYVQACTYLRRGIAANPYIAEAITGRKHLTPHAYRHFSSTDGPQSARSYLKTPQGAWDVRETQFMDWVFNCSLVLRERAERTALLEARTHESDPDRRVWLGRQLGVLFDQISDAQSKQIVRQVKAIHRRDMLGQKVWPWEQHR